MANNIIPLDPNNFSSEVYSPSDEALITSNLESNQFDINTDYVEFFVFDLNNNQIIPAGNDATFSNYSLLDNEIYVDPSTDLERVGIDTGIINTLYNFYRKRLNSSPQSTYYIKEISSNRTEIRLDSNIISREDIITSTNEFISYREEDETFPDFYINLGSNLLFIANNIKLDEDNTILIKLYEPLPANIQLKTSLWVVEKISEGNAYRVEFEDTQEFRPQLNYISGPNLNLSIKDELNNSSEAISLSEFGSPNSQSEYQINSFFEDPSIQINVDYTEFENFVNFSSARNRLDNFFEKVSLIETSSLQLSDLDGLTNTSAVSASKATLNGIINDTITNFDNYEYYLYFESSSTAYPKTNRTPPYQNASTGSAVVAAWSESLFESASDYDRENQDWLKYSIPEYLRDDSANDQYLTFVNMIGHFVDSNIWVYLKDTTNKWNADNRINAGVSKDLIAQILRDLGVKIYQNNYSTSDLYSSFLGFTDSGSLFPFPYMTGSLPTPEGYEYISNFISSSDEAIPLDDINKRIYKRIYHNLPYLLKSKGTVEGLRTLINSYGIPDTILRISEFGGKDKINTNDWDLWKHQFNYSSEITGSNFISSSWSTNTAWGSEDNVPEAVQLRFKAGTAISASASQSLWSIDDGSQVKLVLEYDTNLPITSGSYSGSIIDPEYQYADLKFTVDNFTTSASVRLPFYNNDWWSVQINRTARNDWELISANKIYSGSDGSQIGFIASESFAGADETAYIGGTTSFFPSEDGNAIGGYIPFSGSYQEIRYFNQPLSSSVFRDYTMNPQSTEGNGVNGSPSQLIFRASLGGDLYTGSESIHPKITGSSITQSFSSDSDFYIDNSIFKENKEWVFYDSPAVGIKNRNTDKIKRQDLVLAPGNTTNTGSLGVNALSNLGSIQQTSFNSESYTNNLNLLEVAFSPQNQINDDIISQIGFFNIGDYIGDPRLISSSANTYPSLVDLSQEYFDKYSSNYDVYDYIRLIKFFDNSLFKMVKDFVPARTGLATGVVIKQHLLERQKYPTPQAEQEQFEYTGSIGQTAGTDDEDARMYIASGDFESNPLYTVEGGAGGSVNKFNRPVAFFRITDTPNVTLNNSTFTTLLDQSPNSRFAGADNPGVTFNPGGINNGEFKNGTGYDITTNFTFKFKNANLSQTLTIQLVEVDGGVIKEVSQTLSTSGASAFFTYHFNNVTLKKDKSYFFRAKSSSVGSPIINTFDVRFFQEGAPLDLRNGQFYEITNTTPVGDLTQVIGDSHEFYDGEYSGSTIITTDGELNPDNEIKKPNTTPLLYDIDLGYLQGQPVGPGGIPSPSAGELYWYGEVLPARGFSYPVEINYIEINEIDKNGVSIESTLESLSQGTLITFRAKGRFNSGGIPPTATTLTKTFENIEISSVAGVGGGAWRIFFKTQQILGSLSFNTISNITQTTITDFQVVIDPQVEGGLTYSDDNPLINNATEITPSVTYFDLDYTQNAITPVNFDLVISGSATKAPIQDYNYFARRSIIPRYGLGAWETGSKNTVDSYNTGSGLNAQVSAGTFIGYYDDAEYTSLIVPPYNNQPAVRMKLRYLIDVNGDITQVSYDEKIIGILEQNFTQTPISSSLEMGIQTSISGSTSINTFTQMDIDTFINPNSTNLLGIRPVGYTGFDQTIKQGFVYPKGLTLTSANEILQKAEQILREARII